MVHEKVLGQKLSRSIERMNRARLLVLLALVLALLRKKGRLSAEQRKSLAISENVIGIRKQVLREEGETSTRKKGRTRKGRKNARAARAMRYAHAHDVSLKEAWKHV